MRAFRIFHLLVFLGSLAVTAFLLGRPVMDGPQVHGGYFGYFPLKYLYVGLPAAFIAVVSGLTLLVPKSKGPAPVLKTWVLAASILMAVAVFDLGYTFGLLGVGTPHYWLDAQHVTRADNEPDDELGFRRKPNVSWSGPIRGTDRVVDYQADSMGFRNPSIPEAPEVVFVGDSYTEAAQVDVDKCFVQQFAKSTGKSVLSLGRGAYGPQQEVVVMRRHAFERGEPKVVVWQLFDGNDLQDAREYAAWKAGDYESVGVLDRYLANSMFRPFFDGFLERKGGDFATLDLGDGPMPVTLRYRWMPDQTVTRADGWAATQVALRDGAAFCKDNGARLLVVFVPIMTTVLGERVAITDAGRADFLPSGDGRPDGFGARLAEFCQAEGIELLDLLPVFRAAASKDPTGLYIPRDEHLDERGHVVVADAIRKQLGD